MNKGGTSLSQVLELLESCHPKPSSEPLTDPFEQILYVNVAYLLDDERHKEVFNRFRKRIGLLPKKILAASLDEIRDVLEGSGMHAPRRAARIVEAAEIVVEEYDGNLQQVLDWPARERNKALGRFPAIGAPGVEKILLFSRTEKVLALESNGLRVLQRLGFGQEKKSYQASYKSSQEAVADELPDTSDALIKAHLLLRQHGKEVCRNTRPACTGCRLKSICIYGKQQS